MRHLPLLAILLPSLALASAPGEPLRARRATGPLVIDGRLEEPAWDDAAVYDGFQQLFPTEGAAPSERTEVRVLYDDRNLYVGITCRDSRPAEIVRPLGRRDRAPFSDSVAVAIDSNRDRRTAYYFELNAAGVQGDALLLGEDNSNDDWDAVWDGAVSPLPDGWSAEFLIPLSVLRFSSAAEQVWGIGFRRVIGRTHEELLSFPMKRSDRGVVARLADLTGLSGIEPVQELSVAPYAAARLTWRPASDAAPQPRLVDPSGDVGVDLRASVGRGLALQATINPDFGQVEADQITQNLSTFELFFPEKRPFFTQGLDLFQGVAPADHRSPQQLFYSRRIGLDAPILGAAKLSGRLSDEFQLGLLDAVVAGAAAPPDPQRSYYRAPTQPFHFAYADAYPAVAPARRNFLAATGRWQPQANTIFGVGVTSVLPLDGTCTPEEASQPDDVRPAHCDVDLGHAASLDWSLRTADGAWYLRGQLVGSEHLGGAPVTVLADGTALATGDLGGGGFVAAGLAGGEPWRFDLDYEYSSPRLDTNAAGYQRTQNDQLGRAVLRYVRPSGGGPFHSYGLHLGGQGEWTTDGLGHNRGNNAFLAAEAQLKSFDYFGCNVWAVTAHDDVREISQTGVALRMPGGRGLECWVSTDHGRPVWVEGGVERVRTPALGPLPAVTGWSGAATATVRLHPAAETGLELSVSDSRWPIRFVEQQGSGFLFGALHAPSVSLTLRQLVVLTPRLTLQGYAQVFTSYGRYGPYYTASGAAGEVIQPADLVAGGAPGSDPDFRDTALNLSVVLRWEYRLGSTVYLVYTHQATAAAGLPAELTPLALRSGPINDTLLAKWTWYWSR